MRGSTGKRVSCHVENILYSEIGQPPGRHRRNIDNCVVLPSQSILTTGSKLCLLRLPLPLHPSLLSFPLPPKTRRPPRPALCQSWPPDHDTPLAGICSWRLPGDNGPRVVQRRPPLGRGCPAMRGSRIWRALPPVVRHRCCPSWLRLGSGAASHAGAGGCGRGRPFP